MKKKKLEKLILDQKKMIDHLDAYLIRAHDRIMQLESAVLRLKELVPDPEVIRL